MRESALRNAAQADKTSHPTAESSVHHIAKKWVNNKSTNNQNKFDKYKKPQRNNNKFKSTNKEYICFCCGKVDNHYLEDCRSRNSTCTFCKDKCHIEKMYFKKSSKDRIIKKYLSDFERFNQKSKGNVNGNYR